jgi:hypothetical protein
VGLHSFSTGVRYVQAANSSCNVVAVCGQNATCDTKPNAYDVRVLGAVLPVELRSELGIH